MHHHGVTEDLHALGAALGEWTAMQDARRMLEYGMTSDAACECCGAVHLLFEDLLFKCSLSTTSPAHFTACIDTPEVKSNLTQARPTCTS